MHCVLYYLLYFLFVCASWLQVLKTHASVADLRDGGHRRSKTEKSSQKVEGRLNSFAACNLGLSPSRASPPRCACARRAPRAARSLSLASPPRCARARRAPKTCTDTSARTHMCSCTSMSSPSRVCLVRTQSTHADNTPINDDDARHAPRPPRVLRDRIRSELRGFHCGSSRSREHAGLYHNVPGG